MDAGGAEPDARASSKTTAGRLKMVLSYTIAALCLAWVLYNVHPESLWRNISHLKWRLVLLAIAVDNLNYIAQAVRWKFLLRPVTDLSTGKSVQATYLGVFTSNILPMRLGELVRGHLVSKWSSKKSSEIVPSMVMEHLFEGVWLALGIGLAALFLPLPPFLETAAEIFGLSVIGLAGVFAYALFRKTISSEDHQFRIGPKAKRKFRVFMEQLIAGMKRIGLTANFFLALFVTLASLIFQALALWLAARAYGIPLDVWEGAVALVIVRIGVAVPNAPANIGTYQFFAALALELMGVDRYVAAGFALVLFFISMTPTWIIGFFTLSKSGTTLLRLQQEAQDAARA